MRGTAVSLATVTSIVILALNAPVRGQTEVELIGDDIPSRYIVGANHIFENSDSLFLNDSLLLRDVDYSFDKRRGAFDLSRLQALPDDTLLITYRAVPRWLQSYYGTPLPEVSTATNPIQPQPSPARRRPRGVDRSDIDISGAKTFRFSARSAGSSEFSQSLDLKISGQLMPGLELSGAISDRGYDPSYGTANSRLNELDKLNLKLSSRTFAGQVGDIILDQGYLAGSVPKRVSGVAFDFENTAARAHAAAARPRGVFETVRFVGRDGTQGPYQIEQGGGARPIVPGSETVWLDGHQLERGANKDYVVDYPAGRVTFNVNHPIDSRSRIEIDFEPLQTSYKGELYAVGGGVSWDDTTAHIDVQWLREGDDPDEPITGELSLEELGLLESVGDSVSQAVRSGARSDTLGDYILVVDSLPDTVYQYVGDAGGDFSVSFSYFGAGQGDYIFLGGEQYLFVGDGNGDYRALIVVPVAQRTDYYSASFRGSGKVGDIVAEFQQTVHDRNLFSGQDDEDNDATYSMLSIGKQWRSFERENNFLVSRQVREAGFKTRERLYRPDFRRAHLIPDGFVAGTEEQLYTYSADLTFVRGFTIAPELARLSYADSLSSGVNRLSARWHPDGPLSLGAGFTFIRTDLKSLEGSDNGKANVYDADLDLKLSSRMSFSLDYEHDSRKNDYSGQWRGTRYHRAIANLDRKTERLNYELYLEDTLTGRWSQQLRRNRVSANSARRVGDLNYDALLTYQWLDSPQSDQSSFLSRLNLNYNSAQRRLNTGASYVLSDETRNSRGIAYLEVAQGEGDYTLEGGEFVPDPDGNYIRVEENLSDQSQVRRGEKSFHFDKTWPKVTLRLNSNVQEELLDSGDRKFWWVVPFLSDPDQPYLYYSRRYSGDLRLIPIRLGHVVNITFSDNREIRSVAGAARSRSDWSGAVGLKQVVRSSLLEEKLEVFSNDRDAYFTGGGKFDGYRAGFTYRLLVPAGEVSSGVSFRRADSDGGDRSETYALSFGSRIQLIKKGELRSALELYRQTLTATTGVASFVLTDNRPGREGAIWSVSLRYGIKGDMRVNLTVSGRHSDNRTARVTGRGEFVAGF